MNLLVAALVPENLGALIVTSFAFIFHNIQYSIKLFFGNLLKYIKENYKGLTKSTLIIILPPSLALTENESYRILANNIKKKT